MKRATLIALSLMAVALLLLGSALYSSYRYELDRRLEFRSTRLDTGFSSVVASYHRLVDAIFQQAIQRPAIIDLMAAANEADPDRQRRLRGRLYRELYPVFRLLRERDIRVLQFVLADGHSFLRFHRPDLYADQIAADRPVLGRVLKEKRPVQAFENGRVYPGFRYAFPLIKDGRVVGVADFSAAFDALHRVLHEREGGDTTSRQLLVRRDLVQAVAHPSVATLFRATAIHPAFVTEDETSSLRDITWTREQPPYVQALDAAVAGNPVVRKIMDAGRTAGTHQCLPDGRCFIVSLEPVPDSLGRPAGYIVAYTPTDELRLIRNRHLGAFLVGALLLLGGGTTFRRWLVSRQRLQTISQNMAEGMYVMDVKGRVVYVNSAASELLGFAPAELQGRVAHDLFHVHSGDQPMDAADCPIRRVPLAGRTYSSAEELFRGRDGNPIQVSVTSSPLREEGEITGSVVLFRDVSEEHKARMRLQQSDIAFRNLAEAVMVTDSRARIQAVNRAFTAITGYTEEEILGRNPRLLASGRHDRDFYRAMWNTIARRGTWHGEIWNRRKNGEIYPEWLNISAVHDESGKVVSYVSVFSDVTELRRKEQRLRDLAYHDQLTGLPNRTAFLDLFEHAVQRARRRGTHLALLYLDLDRFKHINDTLGHLVGDRLLQAVARRIRETVRAEDVVARLGGDELTVLLEDVDHDETPARVAHKLLLALRQPLDVENKQLYISASIGISLFPQDGEDTVSLLKNADAAMYRAKHGGRNDYSYFTASMAREAEERFALENDLRGALNERQFLLHYQPKTRTADGEIIGLEALLRWQHPRRGLLTPVHFLDVAGDAGLLPEITEWVVRSAARQLVQWRELGLKPGRVAINLDDQTFNGAEAPQRLERWVRAEGATPEELELEITETVMLQRGNAQPLWQTLADAGFELSIDDFGTGESSLFRLKHLPVRTLKVDKSFVNDIDREHSDQAILRSIVSMAKALGKLVLAEGVERETQLALLRQVGCDYVQGYLTGKPLPVETVTGLLRAGREATGLRRTDRKAEPAPRVH